MKIIKRINHNAIICLDSKGREVIALGNGIGFPNGDDDVEVGRIERTFYDIDQKYLTLVDELPTDVLSCSAQLSDVIRGAVPYELSPNFPVTLADHIAFMLKRAREGIRVQMPLAYDIARLYPLEYRLGLFTVERIERTFGIVLDKGEATGVAMSIMSSSESLSEGLVDSDDSVRLIEELTKSIERELQISIDRDQVDHARFVTHMEYLLRGARPAASSDRQNASLMHAMRQEWPDVIACAESIAQRIGDHMGVRLGADETTYLAIHINRLVAAAKRAEDADSREKNQEEKGTRG